MWGSGALGSFRYPTKMSFLNGAENVAIGHSYGAFDRYGQIWTWGSN
jgi:hypothetical protein